MVNFAQVNKATGQVVNVVVVDKSLPAEQQFVPDPQFDWIEETVITGAAYINGIWDGTVFVPAPKPTEDEMMARYRHR